MSLMSVYPRSLFRNFAIYCNLMMREVICVICFGRRLRLMRMTSKCAGKPCLLRVHSHRRFEKSTRCSQSYLLCRVHFDSDHLRFGEASYKRTRVISSIRKSRGKRAYRIRKNTFLRKRRTINRKHLLSKLIYMLESRANDCLVQGETAPRKRAFSRTNPSAFADSPSAHR